MRPGARLRRPRRVRFTTATATLLVSIVVAVVVGCGSDAPSGGAVSIGAGVTGPSGWKASVYATGMPSIAALALDAKGQVWASTAQFDDTGTDVVSLIRSAGATPQEVLVKQHTPLGLLWYRNQLYVASKEQVVAYAGFGGTRFASQRTVVTLPTGVGEVNGLAIGPDGRMVLGISSPCDACAPKLSSSAAIVSFSPSGGDLQVVASHIRAAVGLAYYPGTSDLFATMNQQDGLGAKTPGDWLGLVRAGQNWKFPGCYGQGGAACTGAPSPVAVLDKHAAVSGLAIVTGQLGPTVGTAALVTEWTTGKVQQVQLTKSGATYQGKVTTLLTGIAKPVAIAVKGSTVLVADWKSGRIYEITTA